MAATDPSGADQERARLVRPYTITSGRTRANVVLPMEATLHRVAAGDESTLSASTLQILEACDTRSVAEVSANVSMPLGVVRVLLSDLVEQGFIEVQSTITDTSSIDERIELIERTLSGLRTY